MQLKKRKWSVLLAALLVLSLCLSGCGNDDDVSEYAACILYGNTRNVPTPDRNLLGEEIRGMAENITNCSIVVLDGAADSISYESIVRYPTSLTFLKGDKDERQQQYVDRVLAEIANDCVPKVEEIDIIRGLYTAQNNLLEKTEKNKKLILFSSGISTKGLLDFASNPELIDEEPQTIVKMLETAESLPDLSGVAVVWHGFGVVENPQEPLTIDREQKLERIWKAILSACKVENVDAVIKKGVGITRDEAEIIKEKEKFPKVSTVSFKIGCLREIRVEFKPQSAEFADEEKAHQELQPYAKYVIQSSCKKFYLIGSTASYGDGKESLKLSRDRADAVKKVLCSMGVPNAYLEVYGIGQEEFIGTYTWRENDLYPNGDLIPEVAQRNRKVIIVGADTKLGKEFIEIWNAKMKNQ